jgi:peroxiredoxin
MTCMKELGELENRSADFARRGARIVVASLEDLDQARQTQEEHPHLIVAADKEKKLAEAFQVLHAGAYTPNNVETNAPTTFLVDGSGTVRWFFRPSRHVERLSVEQLLAAIDQHLLAGHR